MALEQHNGMKPDAREVTQEFVEQFVQNNRVAANNKFVACGDGRYPADFSKGGNRIFGADAGVLAAIFQTSLVKNVAIEPVKLVNDFAKAVKIVRNDGEAKIEYHTAEHGICGHMGDLSHGEYGTQMSALFDAMRTHSNAHVTVLPGEHAEKFIIREYGDEQDPEPQWTTNSLDGSGNMAFVISPARANPYVRAMVGELKIPEISAEDVIATLDKQTNDTAKVLAPGMPIFDINYRRDGSFAIKKAGEVPQKA